MAVAAILGSLTHKATCTYFFLNVLFPAPKDWGSWLPAGITELRRVSLLSDIDPAVNSYGIQSLLWL